MFLNPLRQFRRTLGYRLNVLYASIFVASASVLFVLFYFLLSVAVERKDREVVEAQLKEYSAIYQSGGAPALENWFHRAPEGTRQKSFFVRVVNPRNAVLFMTVPEDWVTFDSSALRAQGQVPAWIRIPKDEEKDFTLASGRLWDGSEIQVGRSTNSRETLLEPF